MSFEVLVNNPVLSTGVRTRTTRAPVFPLVSALVLESSDMVTAGSFLGSSLTYHGVTNNDNIHGSRNMDHRTRWIIELALILSQFKNTLDTPLNCPASPVLRCPYDLRSDARIGAIQRVGRCILCTSLFRLRTRAPRKDVTLKAEGSRFSLGLVSALLYGV
jgi:hypothetical protein